MAVPRHKHTRASVGQRRMHIHALTPVLTLCQRCGSPVRPHTVCRRCGHYKGREVVNVMAKLTKKEQKQRAKEIHETEQQHERQPAMDMEQLSKKP